VASEFQGVKRISLTLGLAVVLSEVFAHSARPQSLPDIAYLGFDRNTYPGDANLKALHQTFSYTGYWLNNPPGSNRNSWKGHRAAVESAGLGFLVLFTGRFYADLKTVSNATRLAKSDAQAATARAAGVPSPSRGLGPRGRWRDSSTRNPRRAG